MSQDQANTIPRLENWEMLNCSSDGDHVHLAGNVYGLPGVADGSLRRTSHVVAWDHSDPSARKALTYASGWVVLGVPHASILAKLQRTGCTLEELMVPSWDEYDPAEYTRFEDEDQSPLPTDPAERKAEMSRRVDAARARRAAATGAGGLGALLAAALLGAAGAGVEVHVHKDGPDAGAEGGSDLRKH